VERDGANRAQLAFSIASEHEDQVWRMPLPSEAPDRTNDRNAHAASHDAAPKNGCGL
jgi:leucyl aminopeptidase